MTEINPISNLNMDAFYAPMSFDSLCSSGASSQLFSFDTNTIKTHPLNGGGYDSTNGGFGFDVNTMIANFTAALNGLTQNYSLKSSEYVDDGKLAIDLSAYSSTQIEEEPQKPITYDAKQIKDKWSNKKSHLTDNFYNRVVEIAKKIKCDPNDLMCLMNSESGIDPTVVNPQGGATGLIQFMPKTAKAYGTTTEALKTMSAEKQLDYVEKFLINAKKQARLKENDTVSPGTLYAMVFVPAHSHKNIIAQKGDGRYDAAFNSVLDIDEDNLITKNDLAKRLHQFDA